jgi:hypothetical protein
MMNKKLAALLLAVSTISTSMFAFFDEVVGGTFDAAERVATVPVDATEAAVEGDGETWRERREERREDRRERRQDRRERRQTRRANRRYDY